MNIIDLSSHFCVGPMYTFYVEGVGQSYIDNCIISSQLSKCVVPCEVIEDNINNTSQAYPN